jgi:hypothetical protein
MTAPITTSVTICNSALFKMGGDKIGALTESTRSAIVCNTLYDYLRDEVMSASPWRFAIKKAKLSPVTPSWETALPAGTIPWKQYYQIPSDCLRPLTISENDEGPWTQEGPYIVCQPFSTDQTILLKYIYRNTDESSWTAMFCETLAWRLAMELAIALTESLPRYQAAEKSYKDQLAEARAINGVVGTIPPLMADIWSRARRGDYYWRRSQGQGTDGENYDP